MKNKQKGIQIQNVTFSYKKNEPIISKITLDINKGDFIGITGVNGSGKSTLAAALTGRKEYEVNGGEVLFSGKNNRYK